MRARLVSVFLLAILISSICAASIWTSVSFQVASATSPSTLAETINSVVSNINWAYGDSWTANWAMILANRGDGAFDEAITADVDRGNYLDALYVARLAELNGYSSETVSDVTQTALQQMLMCGSLPITANANGYGDPDRLNSGCYLVYHRFALWGYKYAEECGLAGKWNASQAFKDFSEAYDDKPINSVSGEMLWCDPQESWAKSFSSRYYDEHAEILSVFLKFAELGVPNAMAYADSAWSGVQAHWNGQYYGYTGTGVVECEMGNFAQIIAEYKDQKGGTIPYWDRVISDLNYKLLANGWESPGWAIPGVLVHATTNSQLRLWETMGAVIALQQLFPDLTQTMKTRWADMLMGSSLAWQGLIASSLNQDGYFSGVGGSAPSNDATVCAAATLFLYGIVPVTGSLAIPNREECYNDLRTPFVASNFKFDYVNRLIRIPVHAGKITFIYGETPVSYTFPADGVYTIKFSDDWNQVTAVNDQSAYLVVRGSDNNIYYRMYELNRESWDSWIGMPGSTSNSPAAAIINGELHVVVRGMDNNLWHSYVNLADTTFSGWTRLSGSTPSAPTLTSNGTVLTLVVRGADDRIYYCTYGFSPRGWGEWGVLTGATCDSPAAAMLGDYLHVVVRGMDGNMWNIVWEPGVGVVRDWVMLSGSSPSRLALVADETAGRLYLAVRGDDSRVYWRSYDGAGDSWGGWSALPTGWTCDGPAVTVVGGELRVVVRCSVGVTIYDGYVDLASGEFGSWTLISGSTPSPPTLTS